MRTFRFSLATMAAAALLSACDSPSDNGRREPARLTIVSGDLQTATVGAELSAPLVVRVEDDKGRPVSNQLVNFVVTAGGGSVFAGSALTSRDGEARERWTLGTTAGDTQRVEARAVDAVTGEAKVFAVFRAVGAAAAASGLAAVGQTNLTAPVGTPLTVSVKVTDAFGNPVAGAQVSWVVTAGGGQAAPPTSATGADGVASTQWTLAPAIGTAQSIEARVAGKTVVFQAFANIPDDLVIEKLNGFDTFQLPFRPDTSIAYPDTLTLTARVRRPDGTPVAGVVFTVREVNSANVPLNNIPYPDAVSDANGVLTVRWPATKFAGLRRMNFFRGPLYVQFSFNRQAGPPARLLAFHELTNVNGGRARARVWDALSQPLPGVNVSWAVVEGNGSVSPAVSATDATGTASTTWTLGSSPGPHVVRATVGALQDTAGVVVAGAIQIVPVGGWLPQWRGGSIAALTARITSPAPLVSATVEVLSQTYALSPTAGGLVTTQPIDLSNVPTGRYLAVFRATDAAGNQGYAEQLVGWARTPVVTFTTPSAPSVTAADSVRVVVQCTGDPGQCAELYSTLAVVTPANTAQVILPLAPGRTGIDAWVSLPQAGTYRIEAHWGFSLGAGIFEPIAADTVTVTASAPSASARATGTAPRLLRWRVPPPLRPHPASRRAPAAPAPRRRP